MNDRERLVRLLRLPREDFEATLAALLGDQQVYAHAPEAPRALRALDTIGLAQQQPALRARLDQALGGDDPLADWIAKELEAHDHVPLLGFRGRVMLPLDEVFVPLQLWAGRLDTSREAFHSLGAAERPEPASPRTLSPAECLAHAFARRCKGVVFLGLPGAGKSTLLKHLFTRVAHGGAEAMGLDPGTVPVLLSVADIVDDWESRSLTEIIAERARSRQSPRAADALTLAAPPLLVMLDGLDEVRDTKTRAGVCRRLEQSLEAMNTARFVVTCRYAAWSDLAMLDNRFQAVDVLILGDEQIARYVRRWFPAVEHALAAGQAPDEARATRRAEALLEVLSRQQRSADLKLRELIGNPLMLSTVCLIFQEDNSLPEQRAALYDRATRLLLQNATQRWGEAACLPEEPSRRVLERVAWEMHCQQWVERDEAEVLPFVDKALHGRSDIAHDAAGFLKAARDESGILASYDVRKVRFLHLTFQEYLASCYARNHNKDDALAQRADDTFWREVILLAATQEGRFVPFVTALGAQGRIAASRELLHECLADLGYSPAEAFTPLLDAVANAREADARWHATPWLKRLLASPPATPSRATLDAAAAVMELWHAREREAARAWANRFVDDPDPTLREAARACLGLVGSRDESFVEPTTGMEFLWVPPGEFWMGASTTPGSRGYDQEAVRTEAPVHKVTLTEGYWLSRFPVTNADYLRFVQATGAEPAGSFSNARFNDPLQPVVEVGFEAAEAFCAWLHRTSLSALGRTASLPTEAEWEFAARGPEGRRYPWGEEAPDASRAVWGLPLETGHTARVGGRPLGRGPFGHEEMAGNVWEWCRDAWREGYGTEAAVVDPCHQDDNGAPRVVRGGSWRNRARYLRCATRNWSHPRNRLPLLGFRVVVRVSRQRA